MKTLIAALFLAAGLTGAVLAQTAEVEVTPAEAFAKAIAARAEPAAADGFEVEGRMFMGDVKLGTFRFSATVVEEDGKKLFLVEDHGDMDFRGQSFSAETRTWLDARLVTLRGEETRDDNGPKSAARWVRTKTGYTIVEKRGEEEEREKTVDAPAGLLSNVSGVILFARALPAEAGTYAFRSLNALNKDDEDVEEILLTAQGKKEWNGMPALLFHRRDGSRDVTFALDVESRAFLGMRMEEEGGPTVEFRAGPGEEETPVDDRFTPPAGDAKTCGLIAALAYRTGDGALLSSVCDWDAIVADLRGRYPEQEFEKDALRTTVVDRLNDYAGARPRETVAPVILAIAGQVKVEEEGDRATVRFPPMFQNLTIQVGRFGDEWRLVALPGT